MGIFNEEPIYSPFGGAATAENPTTAYKKQPDLQHALGYDNSVSPDTDAEDYVRSREDAILKYLESHSENSHTFRIKCDMPGDEDRPNAYLRKKFAIHAPHYIKFTRVPDINKCTFGEGKNRKTFAEMFGKGVNGLGDFSGEEQAYLTELFNKMKNDHIGSIPFEYVPEGQDTPITVKMNIGYSLVIENIDIEKKSIFPKWSLKAHQREVREEELEEQKEDRKAAMESGEKYEDEKLNSGIMRMRWIDPRYESVPPDDLLSEEEIKLREENREEFAKTHSQIPADKLSQETGDRERKKFDEKILERKYEMFQRLDHTGAFSDNLSTVERKDKLFASLKNMRHETARTLTNMAIRAPLTSHHAGHGLLDRLMSQAMSLMRYR